MCSPGRRTFSIAFLMCGTSLHGCRTCCSLARTPHPVSGQLNSPVPYHTQALACTLTRQVAENMQRLMLDLLLRGPEDAYERLSILEVRKGST